MMLAAAALTVLLMTVTGWAMFRRLARYLLAGRSAEVSETELQLLGVLPGLALVGTVASYLAVLHLLRFGFVVFIDVAVLYVARREVYALLVNLCGYAAGWLAEARRGNLFPLMAFGGFCAAFLIGLLLCAVPSDNIDVWVFHIPLAQSFIAHHGFVAPQLKGMLFYSNLPEFFEMLFAVAMLAAPNFAAANVVNLAILFGFVFLLLAFVRRARDIQFVILLVIFFWWQNFPLGSAQPMTDMTRSCYSAAAYLFAYRYACSFRCFELVMSALLAGAAAAGKYMQLLTPALIFVTLFPLMIAKRHTWFHLALAVVLFVAVTAVWYVKNAILMGNPIYPFVFGHPGLSDQWMVDYAREMSRPFYVADRGFSTNLLTLKGWRDFGTVLYANFLQYEYVALLALLGLVFAQSNRVTLPVPGDKKRSMTITVDRRWMLPFWTAALFIVWYAVMFNSLRWAMTAILMLLATAFITWLWILDHIARVWNPAWPVMVLEAAVRWLKRHSKPWMALTSLALAVLLACGLVRMKEGHGHFLLPTWMNHDLAVALVRRGRLEPYLEANKPGYAMYRYIGQHNLGRVFQPFDNGAVFYASAYNGGQPDTWIVPYDELPASVAQTDAFVAREGIHYFIDAPLLDATTVERLNILGRVDLARAAIGRLKSHSRLVYDDGRGMLLYQILPQDSRQ